LLQLISTARAGSATLPQLFPVLVDLPKATALTIAIGWNGLSPLAPISADYSIELKNDQFEGMGNFKVAAMTATRTIVIPTDIVRSFLMAVIRVELVEKNYVPRITRTDDYPSFSVAVKTELGPLVIATQSQTLRPNTGTYVDRTPWAIRYSDRTFVVTASDLDQALGPLEPYLQENEVVKELANQIRSRNVR
jgi:hypothetical protein